MFDAFDLPLPTFFEHLDTKRLEDVVAGLAILIVGITAARFVARVVRRLTAKRSSDQHGLLAGRITFYLLSLLVTLEALNTAGFDFKILLGAAGVLTIALGFAAQTSASNLISGLFLMAERPFVLGDTVQTGEIFGEVVSIDLLSVKIRTFDNRWVRIPNESLLKLNITNVTHFPIRRLDVDLGIAYRADLGKARAVLERVAEEDEQCLDEPKPTFFFLGFGDSALQIRFSAWCATPSFIEFKTRFLIAIKTAFDAEGIEFPFPQRTLSSLDPLEVRVVRDVVAADRNALPPDGD